MKIISVFDTTICNNNLGNQIIMQSVNKVLMEIFPKDFFITIPCLEGIERSSIKYLKDSDYKIFGGTNSLSSEMNKYSQWGLTPFNYRYINNVLLLGMGWWQYQLKANTYTKKILQQVLHPALLHSVRDNYTECKLRELGFDNVVNTGCPTLWDLTKEHCAKIPIRKAPNVLVTFTDYNQDMENDIKLIKVLQNNYNNIYCWVQGPGDFLYAKKMFENIKIIDPNLHSLENFLLNNIDVDYVGTRLHAGIKAMQLGKRTIILSVDNRATEMAKDFNLPVIERKNIKELESRICSEWNTSIKLPQNNIDKWKGQFFQKQNFNSKSIKNIDSNFSRVLNRALKVFQQFFV